MASFFSSLGRSRHHHFIRLYSSSAAAVISPPSLPSDPPTISYTAAKLKLRKEHDPEKVISIFNSISHFSGEILQARYAQDLLAKRLAKFQRYADIETLLEKEKQSPLIRHENFLSGLILAYGRAGMLEQAIRTFDQMDELGTPRSSISFNALLASCNSMKEFEQVPKLFSEIPTKFNVSPDKKSYGILVKSCCELGSPESAFPILEEMEKNNVEITVVTYTTLLDAFYKRNMFEDAEKVWGEMGRKGISPDGSAYNVRLMYIADHGKPEEMLKLFDEMVSAGVKPDAISYNYLMTCYFKNGKIEDAKEVYKDFEANGCFRNAATYRIFVFYVCKNEDFDLGFKVCMESLEKDRIPDFGTVKLLANGLAKNSRLEDAKRLIGEVKKMFPTSFLKDWKKLEMGLGLLDESNGSVEDSKQSDAD